MKQQRLLIMMFLLVLHQLAFATPRTFRQAQAIAERQAAKLGIVIDQKAMAQSRARYAASSRAQSASAQAPYYVFTNGEGKGFTIVSGDDQMPEIVGYADHGTYDESEMPEGFKVYMTAYQEKAAAIAKGNQQALQANAVHQALLSGKSYQQPTVAPLLGNIAWNQDAPYNDLCPDYKTGEKCAVGCTATAMAQVMRYYKYPEKLMGDIKSYQSTEDGHTISLPGVAKGQVTFDWDNMLDTYKAGNYTKEQANAVATLSYYCGLAVQMQYSLSSGSFLTTGVLAQTFGYDADLLQQPYRGQFSLAEWMQMIDHELEAARPIIYGGQSSAGGHMFVCDGADGTGLYHINWGWGGYGNGYYDLTILDPTYRGIGSGTAQDGFIQDCYMTIGIAPDNGKKDEPEVKIPQISVSNNFDHTCEILKAFRDNASQAFKLVIATNAANYTCTDFTGDIAIGIKKTDGTYEPLKGAVVSYNIGGMEAMGGYYSATVKDTILWALPVDTTIIYNLYRTKGGEWQAMGYLDGCHPFVLVASETSLTCISDQLEAQVVADENMDSESKNPYTVTLTNKGLYEYLGSIRVYASSKPVKPEDEASTFYVQIPVGGTATRNLSIPATAGDQYIWICDANDTLLVDGKKFTVKGSTDPTGIQPVITTPVSGIVNVYSLGGQLVKRIASKDGKLSLQSLPKGIYIVEGKKVIIK